jgi:FSR family fosmidomycin resistance protein-like MFS transporter
VTTTLEVIPIPPVAPPAMLDRPRLRLWTPIAAHSVTDFLSFVAVALMPLLAVRLGMTVEQKALLLGLGAAASGAVQPLVAWISDRFDSRATGTGGLVIAAVCVGMLGFARSFEQLLMLYFFAVLGVGAFHPASAAAVGALAGRRRSAMVSVFFLFGMLGGIGGNVLSPMYVNAAGALSGAEGEGATDAGLRSLIWFAPPALVMAWALAWAIHPVSHRRVDAHAAHHGLTREQRRRRWGAVWLLYACNVVRFTVNQMLVYLLIEWAERLTRVRAGVGMLDVRLGQQASELNGPMQASLQVGMGFGGLGLGLLLSARLEKRAFVLVPLIGAAAIAALPHTDARLDAGLLAVAVPAGLLAAVAGFGFGALVPVSMALGQRLLPHRTSLASGLLLGGSWSVAFIGPQIARLIHRGQDGNLEAGFLAAGAMLVLSSALAMALPRSLMREVSAH